MVENAWAHAGPQEPSAPEEGMAVAKLAPLTKHARSVASGVAEHTASALSKAGSQAGKQQEPKAHPALRAQEHPALTMSYLHVCVAGVCRLCSSSTGWGMRGGQPPKLKSGGFSNLSFVHFFGSCNIIESGGQAIGTHREAVKMEPACPARFQDSESRIGWPTAAWLLLRRAERN